MISHAVTLAEHLAESGLQGCAVSRGTEYDHLLSLELGGDRTDRAT